MPRFTTLIVACLLGAMAIPAAGQQTTGPFKGRKTGPSPWATQLKAKQIPFQQTDFPECKSACRYEGIILAPSHKSSTDVQCLQDVVLGQFLVGGTLRRGITVEAVAISHESGEKQNVTALVVSAEGDDRIVVRQFCLPLESDLEAGSLDTTLYLSDRVLAQALPDPMPTTIEDLQINGGQVRNWSSIASRAFMGTSLGIGSITKRRALEPWETAHWWTVAISSAPPGAEILMRGSPLGYDTNRTLRLQPSMLTTLSLRTATASIPVEQCIMTRAPRLGIDLEINCEALRPKPPISTKPPPKR